MIYLVVLITAKEGKLKELIRLINETAIAVRQEKGCIEYFATIDTDTGLPPQAVDKSRVVLLERWESLEAQKAHLETPHMKAYFKNQAGLVEGSVLMALKEA